MAYKTTSELWDYLQDVLARPTEYRLGRFGQMEDGKLLYDCVCLIKSFPWCDGEAGKMPTYQKNGVLDEWIGAFYEKAGSKSTDIGSLPNTGIYLIYMNNDHIAIYNADTKTEIECCAGQTMKVVERPLYYYDSNPSLNWNKWSDLYWCPQGKINIRSTIYKPEPEEPKEIYRVRLSWENKGSQIGAYEIFDNAINKVNENPGYKAYNSNGIQVYPEVQTEPVKEEAIAGKKIELNNTSCYSSAGAGTAYDRKTGTYYVWSSDIVNNRIRITNSPDRVGVANQVTCWVDINDVGLKPVPVFTIKVGDTVTLKQGAKYHDGKQPASFMYSRKCKVKSIDGDKARITYIGIVMGIVYLKDLMLV